MSTTRTANFSRIFEEPTRFTGKVTYAEPEFPTTREKDDIDFTYNPTAGMSFLHVSFSVVVLCTIVESLLVCAVNIKNKDMLRSPYNVNIFHLAISDLFVALVIALTPGFICREILIPPEGRLAGELFCRVISSHFLVFSTATTSIYITVALATERWYAVTRPLQYRAKFHTKRLIGEVFIIWVLSLGVNAPLLFKVNYDLDGNVRERCKTTKTFADPLLRRLLAIAQLLLKFLAPFLITCKLYYHVLHETGKSHLVKHRRGVDTRHSISRMSAMSTLVLALCWFPNQVYYTCHEFDLLPVSTPPHYATIVIALINSCLNPFIFAFHSRQYRYGFKNLLCRTSKKEEDRTLKMRVQMFKLAQITCGVTGLRAPPSPSLLPKRHSSSSFY